MFRRFLKKQTKSISKWAFFSLFFICFVLGISFGINIVKAIWHEPTAVPAGDNIFGFLNISPDNQAKKGKLRLGSSDLTNFTYSLEVRGESEISQLKVDTSGSFSNTLYINQQGNHNVGIGKDDPTTKLEVSGGGVTVGGIDNPLTSGEIAPVEGYSSGDIAIYGEATNSYYGVRGINNYSYGVWGVSDFGYGVYGKSRDKSGVMSEISSEKYGIYGCSGWDDATQACSPSPLVWASYFSGRVIADNNDVIGTRFLPEKLQASLIPFTQGQTMSLKSDLKLYYPVDIAFDGEYLWTIKDGWYGYISRVRPADGIKTDYQFSTGIGCNDPSRIIYAGGYLWVTCNGTHRIVKIDPNDGTQQTAYATKPGSVSCGATGEDQETYYQGCSPYALIYDDKTTPGEPYIWTTNYRDPDAYPDPDERYYDDIPGTSSVSRIRVSDGNLDVYLLQNQGNVQDTKPTGITLDDKTAGGPYVWTANTGSYPSGFSLPADSISQVKTDGTFVGTYSIDDDPNDSIHQKPVDIIFDGTSLWTANNGFADESCWDWRNGGCPNVAKIDPTNPASIDYYMAYGVRTHRLLLDDITTGGPYIWTANETSLTRMDLDGNLLRNSCGSPPCSPKYSSIVDPGGLVTTQPITEDADQYTNIWVTDTGKFRLAKIKSSDNTIDKTFLLGGTSVADSTFDGSYIWTADVSNNSISKIRAADGQKIVEYTTLLSAPNSDGFIGDRPYQILSDGENIWAVHHNWSASTISKFKASDGTPLDPKAKVLAWTGSPSGLVLDNVTANEPYLWILLSGYGTGSSQESKLIKYNISDNAIENTYSLGLNLPSIQGNPQKPRAMTFDGEYLWLANYYDDSCKDNKCGNGAACNNDADCDIYNLSSIMRIDPADPVNGREPEDLPAGYQPQDIIFDGKYLWTANYGNGSVSKWFITSNPVDPLTKIADYLIDDGAKPSKLTFDGTYIWVAEEVRSDNTNYLTVLRASDGSIFKSFEYDQYAGLNGLMFDGDAIWLAGNGCGNTDNTLYKYYSGSGYGQQAIEQVVRLQNIVPGYVDGEDSDFEHFNISGIGTVGGDVSLTGVASNVSVANNVWGAEISDDIIEGDQWEKTGDIPDGPKSPYNTLSLLEASDGALFAGVSYNGRVYKSTDRGDNWTDLGQLPVVNSGDNVWVWDLLEANDGYIYAAYGVEGDPCNHGGRIARSDDGGNSWNVVYNLTCVSGRFHIYTLLEVQGGPNQGLYAGLYNTNTILKSTDGSTWVETAALPAGAGNIYVLLEANDGYLYTGSRSNNHISKTNDGGNSWVAATDISGISGVYTLLEASDGYIYAGTGDTNGDVFKSIDGGNTWTNTGNLSGANRVKSLMEMNGVLYAGADDTDTDDGIVFRSDNGGDSWTEMGDLAGAQRVDPLLEASDGTVYAGATLSPTWAAVFRLSPLPAGTYHCPDGHFVKDINYNFNDQVMGFECRAL